MNSKTLILIVIALVIILTGVILFGIYFTSKKDIEENNNIISIEEIELENTQEKSEELKVIKKDYENMTDEELEAEKERLLKILDELGEPNEKYKNMTREELEAEKERLLKILDELSHNKTILK